MEDIKFSTGVDGGYTQKFLQAEKEFLCNHFEAALNSCTCAIEILQSYIDDLMLRGRGKGQKKDKKRAKKSKSAVVSSDQALHVSSYNLSRISSTYDDPFKGFNIEELTELIINPPGYICSESKFGKAFAIFGEDFARSALMIVKRTSIPSLKSLARWSMIEMLENYCSNIMASGNTPAFDEGPDPVLFCPVHDTSELRFDDNAVYPVTTALSNLVRKFVQDMDFCYVVQTLTNSFSEGYSLPVCFHTDLFTKQKMLSAAAYNGNWLDSEHIISLLKEHEMCGNPALLYAFACLMRAYCFFATDHFPECVEDSGAVLRIPNELPSSVKALANLMKAKSLYRSGKSAEEDMCLLNKESDIWKAQLHFLKLYRSAAIFYAYVLELMNESEFNSEMHQCNIEMITCLHKVLSARRGDCQLKTCCLCWRNSELRRSHIIPRFILEALRSEVGILVGNELKGPAQVYYTMLCNECEQRFCNWGETPFKNLFFDQVLEQPSKELEIVHDAWLYYFFASLIWRVLFVLKYKATNFLDMLGKLPLFAMRKFLLTSDVQFLTSDCFLYLFIDKDVIDEMLCKTSLYKSFARKGGGYSFHPDESLFFCYFLNFYLVFPVGAIQNTFLLQGSLKKLKFTEGLFSIEADSQRIMPILLERFICNSLTDEYDNVLASLTHQAYNIISRSLPVQDQGSTTTIPKVIRCLPSAISVVFNSCVKYGIELQGGFKIKHPPIDCRLAEEQDKRYSLYLCEGGEGNQLALYHVYSPTCDHLYAFQLTMTSGEVDKFAQCENIRNKQYFDMLLSNNPDLQDFLIALLSVMALSEVPSLEVHFFPDGIKEYCLLQLDESLLLPTSFSVIGKPVKLKNMIFWLCDCAHFGTIAIWRLFCEIWYDETPPYNYFAALKFQPKGEKVEPLCQPQENHSDVGREIIEHLLKFQSVCFASIELLQDSTFQSQGVVSCLPNDVHIINFFPIDKAKSTENLIILNELGSVSQSAFRSHSWLCSYTMAKNSCLVALEKWKISDLYFVILFVLKSSEKNPLHITNMSTPGTPYTPVFMKMVTDYCWNEFEMITRNIILSVQAALKVNSRVRSIFTTKSDPLMKRNGGDTADTASSSQSHAISHQEPTCETTADSEVSSLDPIICLPPGCSLLANRDEFEMQLSVDYNLLCDPLQTPLYTVWLCAYRDVHELIIVKTTSGIENVCSSVVITLYFVAAPVHTTHSAYKFRFYPFSHLDAGEIDFVEDDFLAGEVFESTDPQFSVLMACVYILLSQAYQSYNLQVYLPLEFQVDIRSDGELQLLYPHSFRAGPIHEETPAVIVTCWLCEESLGLVKIEIKSSKCQYITALTFDYCGSAVSKLELIDLPSGLRFIVQYYLYREKNLSFLIASMFKILCNKYALGEIVH